MANQSLIHVIVRAVHVEELVILHLEVADFSTEFPGCASVISAPRGGKDDPAAQDDVEVGRAATWPLGNAEDERADLEFLMSCNAFDRTEDARQIGRPYVARGSHSEHRCANLVPHVSQRKLDAPGLGAIDQ